MRVSVHIPDEIGEAARRRAEAEGVSVSQFVARAVEHLLEARRREEAHAAVSRLIGTVDADAYPRGRFDAVQHDLRTDDAYREGARRS